MSPKESLDLVSQIAASLALAHQKGIIHRDIKPANILYREDGTPVLTDFGIAKHIGDTELTSTGTILGSPFYMSPEQVEGKVALDGRSDIYSLGVIVYEMLAGRRPYEGDSAINIVLQHLRSPLPILPEKFQAYQPFLNLMLAKNREKRFQDALEVIEYIRAIQSPDSPESTQTLKRHALREAARSTTKQYVSGQMQYPDTGAHQKAWRNRGIFSAGVLLIIVVMSLYFFSEINRYSDAAISFQESSSPPSTAQSATAPTATQSGGEAQGPSPPQPSGGKTNHFQRQVITALKWLARKSLEEQRLTAPPEDNAFYYFSRLWEMDPGNLQAQEGIMEVANRYAAMAEDQLRKKNYDLAENYISQGLGVAPNNKHLQVLRSNTQLREKSLIESIMELFKG
ncbi:MAG: serine/threonine protein kinase [Gammaproteobacteria bacterium]|nr:serine/threonine protein kinase [Gammaproteobacteria bacterium]